MELISIIITIYNGEKWVDKCIASIQNQTVIGRGIAQIEIITYLDFCSDNTETLLNSWRYKLSPNVTLKVVKDDFEQPMGVGYGRNRAISASSGKFLCFQDVDDTMYPERLEAQLEMAEMYSNDIIGSKFTRTPSDSTLRFQSWANNLPHDKLELQIYTSNGPSIIMPTWFCQRKVFDKVGGFDEGGKGVPEDLLFFYQHLDLGGGIKRVDRVLLDYCYHEGATTFSIKEETIYRIRLNRLINKHLLHKPWSQGFTIWNGGKQGRRFLRALREHHLDIRQNVTALCDVDPDKVGHIYKYFDPVCRKESPPIPIIHLKDAKPPVIVCMKLDLTSGQFEHNLASKCWIENRDYILFA